MVIDLDGTEYQLEIVSFNDTWIAHITLSVISLNASIHKPPNCKKTSQTYQQQQKIVRQLLTKLLTILHIKDSCCYHQGYPYRLTNIGYYVCFSHTADGYAVILSKHHSVGIDIEYGTVNWRVASRYFHKNELLMLSKLTMDIKQTLCLQLWQIKECLIKINNQTLAAGMGIDVSFLIERLLTNIIDFSSQSQHQYQLVLTEDDKLPLHPATDVPIFSQSVHHIWIHSANKVVAVF